ncbi:MAG TPA: hypothetical protein VF899_04320 [Pyrinomonadaceae bacterium]
MSTELDHAREIAERIARRVSSDSPSRLNIAEPTPRAQAKPELASELAAVRAGLSELQIKIAQLEAKVTSESMESPIDSSLPNASRMATDIVHAKSSTARSVPLTHSPWLAGVNASISHPSQEKFGVEEAVVSELVDYFEKEKTCSVEPGGKPCDHCAMCSSRGF